MGWPQARRGQKWVKLGGVKTAGLVVVPSSPQYDLRLLAVEGAGVRKSAGQSSLVSGKSDLPKFYRSEVVSGLCEATSTATRLQTFLRNT